MILTEGEELRKHLTDGITHILGATPGLEKRHTWTWDIGTLTERKEGGGDGGCRRQRQDKKEGYEKIHIGLMAQQSRLRLGQ